MNNKKFLLLVSIVLFLAFIFFSYLVAKEKFTTLDFNTTVKLQDKLPRKLDGFFSLFSIFGLIEITGIVWLIFFILTVTKKYWLSAISLFLLPLALAMEVFGKLFVYHPAPPLFFYRGVFQFELPKYYIHTDYSYPSGHVTRAAFLLIFLMAWLYLKSPSKKQLLLQSILGASLFIMAISRIYLGEHWTSDVIGGLLLGTSFGILSGLTIPEKSRASNY